MKLTAKNASAKLTKVDLLVLFAMEGKKPALPAGDEVPRKALPDFSGELREARLTDATAGPAGRVLFIGLGKPEKTTKTVSAESLRRAAAIAVKKAEKVHAKSALIWVADSAKHAESSEAAGQAGAEGARMGPYAYTAMKSKAKAPKLTQLALAGPDSAFRKGVRRGEALGQANAFTRDLQNAPGNHMRPRDLVSAARQLARRSARISCKVIDEKEMKRLGMGSLLGVSAGSSEPAYLIHLSYRPAKKAKRKVALVGKGLTFDAGGISLKPSAKMDEMKYDMSGGAAVLGAFHALGDIDVGLEVHGIVATSENLPDGKANKPGDVCTAMDGTTIEVLNTDAEGRLILADALCYTVKKVQPSTIVDLATLTGAVVVALGHELTGMFASSERLRDALSAAGDQTAERVWPLPLLEEHKDQMKGQIADLRNINSGEGNGSSAGASFLAHFVGDTEWAHLDIAGTAWNSKSRDYVGGPTGSGVGARLLLQYLSNGA